MYRGQTVGVVIPAYNEEGFVGGVLDAVPSFVDRVYVVDDASTDGTWAEIRRHTRQAGGADDRDRATGGTGCRDGPADGADRQGEGDGADRREGADGADRRKGAGEVAGAGRADGGSAGPAVEPIRHERNRGVGGAIKTGYLRALDDGVDVTAVMAGDGQMDPALLDRLLDPVVEGRADYAKANRLVRPEWRAEMPRLRLVGNALLTFLTKVASGYWGVGDPQNGYTAISREALSAVDVAEMFEFYGYCNDLLVRLNVADARVADVPAPPSYGDEESHIDYVEYVPRVSWMLLRTFLWRLRATYVVRDFHPLVVLYGLGVLGGLLGVGAAVRRLVGRERPGRAAVLLLLGGLQVALAMVLDRAENEDGCVREVE